MKKILLPIFVLLIGCTHQPNSLPKPGYICTCKTYNATLYFYPNVPFGISTQDSSIKQNIVNDSNYCKYGNIPVHQDSSSILYNHWSATICEIN